MCSSKSECYSWDLFLFFRKQIPVYKRMAAIIKEKGFFSLYRGIMPGTIRSFLANGTSMVVMTFAQRKVSQLGLRDWRKKKMVKTIKVVSVCDKQLYVWLLMCLSTNVVRRWCVKVAYCCTRKMFVINMLNWDEGLKNGVMQEWQ